MENKTSNPSEQGLAFSVPGEKEVINLRMGHRSLALGLSTAWHEDDQSLRRECALARTNGRREGGRGEERMRAPRSGGGGWVEAKRGGHRGWWGADECGQTCAAH
jgi:hypothetical protein